MIERAPSCLQSAEGLFLLDFNARVFRSTGADWPSRLEPPHIQQNEYLRNEATYARCAEVQPFPLARSPLVKELFGGGKEDYRPKAELHAEGNGEEGGDNNASDKVQEFVFRQLLDSTFFSGNVLRE